MKGCFNLARRASLIACASVFSPFGLVQAADVIDASLKVRFNFDAAPVDEVVADTSPAAAHAGANNQAIWVASEGTRSGVMQFDPNLPSQITIAPAADLNSSVGTISFWMKSPEVTPTPNAYAMIFDRRTVGGDVIYQDPSGKVATQAQNSLGNVNSRLTGRV
jgi:hypothetical protein